MDRLFFILSRYHELSSGLINFLKEKVGEKTFEKLEVILAEGQVDRYIYFIERGVTKTFTRKEDLEHISWVQEEDEFVISVDSFLNQTPSAEWIVAQEKLKVRYLSYGALEEACGIWPEFAIVREKIKTEYYSRKTKWDRWIRSTNNFEKYLQFEKDRPGLAKRIPLTVKSSLLGMDVSTLKRIRKAIKEGRTTL